RPPISPSESYDVIHYRSLGVLVLVAFTVACGGLLLTSVGMALTPNLCALWCGLRGCLGWCVAIGCLALRRDMCMGWGGYGLLSAVAPSLRGQVLLSFAGLLLPLACPRAVVAVVVPFAP